MQAFHFIHVRSGNSIPYYEQLRALGVIICHDWEDSLPMHTKLEQYSIKEEQRQYCIEEAHFPANHWKNAAIRINHLSTKEYPADLKALHQLAECRYVFVPKVASADELNRYLTDIPSNVLQVIPIIETKEGWDNLDAILDSNDSRFNLFAFGHCDFNLSQQLFPFIHHQHAEYWQWIDTLNTAALKHQKQFLNSPVLALNDSALFQMVLSKNKQYPGLAGQITLCQLHSQLCLTTTTAQNAIQFVKPSQHEDIKVISNHYLAHKYLNRNFAVDTSRRIISPQEYQAFQTHLSTLK